MARLAEYSAWAGYAIWLLTILVAPDLLAGPLVRRPRDIFFRHRVPTDRPDPLSPSSLAYDTLIVVNWFGWAYFALRTSGAVLGEAFTPLATATLGFYFIMLCMPLALAAWLWLVHVGSHGVASPKLLCAAPVAAATMLVAYSTIG